MDHNTLSLSELVSKYNLTTMKFIKIMEAMPPCFTDLIIEGSGQKNYRIDILDSFFKRFKKRGIIASELGIAHKTISRWEHNGKFINVERYEDLYDSLAIRNICEQDYNPAFANFKNKTGFEKLLSKEIIEFVYGYVKFRGKGNSITLNGEVKYLGISPKTLKDHANMLFLIFVHLMEYFVIKKLGYDIPTIWVVRDNGGNYKNRLIRSMTDDEIRIFTENPYPLKLFGMKEYAFLQEKYHSATFERIIKMYLKPFYTYYFMLLEDNSNDDNNIDHENLDIKELMKEHNYNKMKRRILSTLSSAPSVKINMQERRARRVFCTPEQITRLNIRVFNRFGLEKSLILAFWMELGLRREESSIIAVEDFWIDDNGYLKQDEFGYGECFFPEAKSKATGADEFPLLVIPSLVLKINQYLKLMYSVCPFGSHMQFAGKKFVGNKVTKIYEDGHGFFFRKINSNPDSHFTVVGIQTFFKTFTKEDPLEFLTAKQRKHLSSHDGRHTLNELVETARVKDINLIDYKKPTADLQMRHAPGNDVGTISYRQITDRNIFREIFECSMNFPKEDLEQLRLWEIDRGYRKPHDTLVTLESGKIIDVRDRIKNEQVEVDTAEVKKESPSKSDLINMDELLKTYQLKSKEIDQILNKKLASRPRDWSGNQWLDEREKLEKEKMQLQDKIKELVR